MPLPDIRVFMAHNEVCDNRACYPATTRYTFGRVEWSGNQQRRRTQKVMPPTACRSVVRTYNRNVYERFDGLLTRRGTIAYVYNRSPIVITNPVRPNDQDYLDAAASAARSWSANTGFAETVAETPSTLRLLNRRAMLFFNIFKLAGSGKFRGATVLLKSATGYNASNRSVKRLEKQFSKAKSYDSRRASAFWLEYSFGIAPLIQSVFDSVDAFQRSTEVKRRFGRGQNGVGFHLYSEVKNQQELTLSELGLTNPALLAWDLLPFSFVVDWFLPISTILAYLSSNRGLGQVYGCRTWTGHYYEHVEGVQWVHQQIYERTPASPPSVGNIFNASARSHGLWTVVTTLALVNSLR